jgi:hypothetical protein
MSIEVESGRRKVRVFLFTEENTEHKVVDADHCLPHMSFGHPRAVFEQGDIPAMVQSIFDAP